LFYIYVFGLMIPAVLAEAISQVMRGETDGDDDEGYLDDFLSIFFGGQVKFLTATVPLLGPAVMSGVNMLNDKWYDDRISVSPAVSMLEAVTRTAFLHPYQALSEDKDVNMQRVVRDVLTTVGLATGLPLGALARPIGYAVGEAEGRFESANELDYVRGLITGRAAQ
jgi:hypothetical protein